MYSCERESFARTSSSFKGRSFYRNAAGHVQLLVSTTPCLSCVCAAMQFQRLSKILFGADCGSGPLLFMTVDFTCDPETNRAVLL